MSEGLDAFLDELCDRDRLLVVIFLVAVAFGAVQLPYLAFADRDTAIFAISALNAIGFLAFGVASGLALRHCRRRHAEL